MSYHSELDAAEQEEREHFEAIQYQNDWRRDTESKTMKRLITQEEMAKAVERAVINKSHVRRLSTSNTFEVRCTRKCQSGFPHLVRFTVTRGELFAECENCPDQRNRTGLELCRHIASAAGLYLYYNEAKAVAA